MVNRNAKFARFLALLGLIVLTAVNTVLCAEAQSSSPPLTNAEWALKFSKSLKAEKLRQEQEKEKEGSSLRATNSNDNIDPTPTSVSPSKLSDLRELLFPPLFNRSRFKSIPYTAENTNRHPSPYVVEQYERNLFGEFVGGTQGKYDEGTHSCPNANDNQTRPATITGNINCKSKCSNLDVCRILNGYVVQEVYYPTAVSTSSQAGTCSIIEDLGVRMSNQIFGVGRTFRDTPACREMVMEYLCLFWGSNNKMYTNCCIYSEYVVSVDPQNQILTRRYPCKSFCIQVAQVCANDESYLQLCHEIRCPPEEDSCEPDPIIGYTGVGQGVSLAASVGCNIPITVSPYAPHNAAPSSVKLSTILGPFIVGVLSLCLSIM